jgi:hypothetical protein
LIAELIELVELKDFEHHKTIDHLIRQFDKDAAPGYRQYCFVRLKVALFEKKYLNALAFLRKKKSCS